MFNTTYLYSTVVRVTSIFKVFTVCKLIICRLNVVHVRMGKKSLDIETRLRISLEIYFEDIPNVNSHVEFIIFAVHKEIM